MSSQRGNVTRTRPQKHKNTFAFKSDLHSTSPRVQALVNMDVLHVCAKCKDIISWKIKYKKYKILKQPKTCSMCKKRNVKQNYHSICTDCADSREKCAKCLEPYDGALYIANEMERVHQDVESMKSEMRRLVTNFEPSLREKSLEFISSIQLEKEDEVLELIKHVKDMKLKQGESDSNNEKDQIQNNDTHQDNKAIKENTDKNDDAHPNDASKTHENENALKNEDTSQDKY